MLSSIINCFQHPTFVSPLIIIIRDNLWIPSSKTDCVIKLAAWSNLTARRLVKGDIGNSHNGRLSWCNQAHHSASEWRSEWKIIMRCYRTQSFLRRLNLCNMRALFPESFASARSEFHIDAVCWVGGGLGVVPSTIAKLRWPVCSIFCRQYVINKS